MIDPIVKAATFLTWYKDPAIFYREVFHEKPYPYQAELLRDLANPELKRVMVMSAGTVGKTKCVACHALWLTTVLPRFRKRPFSVIIVSGSHPQAKNLYQYCKQAIEDSEILRELVAGEPKVSETHFKDRSFIKAVPHTITSTQGLHCDCAIVDEAGMVEDFIIQDTYRMVGSSDFDRIILIGTPLDYFNKFVVMWENPEKYPDWKRYSWSWYQCPRITPEKIEEAKRTLSEEMFNIMVLGKPFAKTGTLIPSDILKQSCKDIPRFAYTEAGSEPVAGIDWGWRHLTTLAIVQKVNDTYYLLHIEGWKREEFEKLHEKIVELCKTYHCYTVYADNEDIGENQRLEARGLRVEPVVFNKEKTKMQSKMRGLFLQNKVRIPNDFTELIRQLRKYTYDTHEDDDYVDAFMLALYGASLEEEEITSDYIVERLRLKPL